jgi:hypothetical protein
MEEDGERNELSTPSAFLRQEVPDHRERFTGLTHRQEGF